MPFIVHFHVSGLEQDRLSTSVLTALGEGRLKLLDLQQTSIHGRWYLSAITEVLDAEALRSAVVAVNACGPELRMSARLMDRVVYQQWLAAEGVERQIITLAANRALDWPDANGVLAIANRFGLSLERLERLSLPAADNGRQNNCWQLRLVGPLADPAAMRKALLEAAEAGGLDISLQRDDLFRRHRRLAVFDMDSTLIQAEVIDELAKVAGVGPKVAAITERAMRGELDFRASFKERTALLKGLPESLLEGVAQRLQLTEGAERLFAALKELGYKTAILSGGFGFFARRIQARLGIDYLFANELVIVDGKLTGEALEPIVDARRKAVLLQELADREGLRMEQTIAVGDGANDLPMLALAGLGVAFHAKPLVRRSAHQVISHLGLDGLLYLLGIPDRLRGASQRP